MYLKNHLSNGIRVVTEDIPYLRSVSVGVWFGVGSQCEDEHNNGVSHFIEHLLFKGTETRSARELAEVIDAVGGQLNAFTSREYTCFHVKVLDNHFPLAVELLSDMVLNSRFAPADIAKEKKVIVEEIKMYEDAPDEMVHDLLTRIVWQGHPLGQAIIGSEESIARLEPAEIIRYFREHYTAGNCVIAVAGNIRPGEVMQHLEQRFGRLGGAEPRRLLTVPAYSQGYSVRTKPTEQVHLCLGTQGVAQLDEDVYASYILNDIIGGGASSHLFQSIREDKGLAYAIYSFQSAYRMTGIFGVYAAMSLETAEAVIGLIREEFRQFRSQGIAAAELTKVKEQLKGGLLLSLENTSTRMSRMAKSELYFGRVVTPDEIIARVDRVSADDIQKMADTILDGSRLSLAAIGPVEDGVLWPELAKAFGQ